jgi:hypothetical protein
MVTGLSDSFTRKLDCCGKVNTDSGQGASLGFAHLIEKRFWFWHHGRPSHVVQVQSKHSWHGTTPVWAFFSSFFFVVALGLTLARQALYLLNHVTSPFCFSYFSDRVLCFCLGHPASTEIPLAGITEVNHHTLLIG